MPTLRQHVFRTFAITAAMLVVPSAVASADTQLITNCPKPTEAGGVILGNTVTQCTGTGDYQYDATPNPQMMPDYPYPWDDAFYGPALIIGGIGEGAHPGGGPR